MAGELDATYTAFFFLENSIRDIFGALSVEKSLQPWLEHCCFCQITWPAPQPVVAAASPVCLLVLQRKGRLRVGWDGGVVGAWWGGVVVGKSKPFPYKERTGSWQGARRKQRRKSAVCLDGVCGLAYQWPRVPCSNRVTSHLLPLFFPGQRVVTQNNPLTFMFPDTLKQWNTLENFKEKKRCLGMDSPLSACRHSWRHLCWLSTQQVSLRLLLAMPRVPFLLVFEGREVRMARMGVLTQGLSWGSEPDDVWDAAVWGLDWVWQSASGRFTQYGSRLGYAAALHTLRQLSSHTVRGSWEDEENWMFQGRAVMSYDYMLWTML